MPRVRLDGGLIGLTNNPTTTVASGMWSLKEYEKFQRTSSWPASYVNDLNFNLTALLLHGDGTNGANNTVFLDSSASPLTITTNGKPAQGTFSPFSQTGWSAYFDGTQSYLYTSTTPAFNLSSPTSWTIECWIYPTSSTQQSYILQNYSQSLIVNIYGLAFTYGMEGTGILSFGTFNGNSGAPAFRLDSAVSANRWTHVAVVRNGSATNNMTLYIDGAVAATGTYTTWPVPDNSFTNIGARFYGSALSWFKGYISNFRSVIGTAVYTSAFTPPTTPLTAITNTQFLAFQDNRLKDNSATGLSIFPGGSTVFSGMRPFSPLAPSTPYSTSTVGGSAYFNGTSDYLTVPSNAALQMGTGDFTIDGWINSYSVAAGQRMIFSHWAGSTDSYQLYVEGTTNRLRWQIYNQNAADTSALDIAAYTWTHVRWVKSGTTCYLFINGVLKDTVTSVTNSANGTLTNPSIGSQNGTLFFNGYISDLRVIKGVALSTSDFTLPGAPSTAVSGTSLLLNATNAGIIDSTGKNVLTTYGSAAVSSTQARFGGTSMYFEGTNSSLVINTDNLNLDIPASSNFTVECWVNTPTASLAPAIWQNTSTGTIIAFFLTDATPNTFYSILGDANYPASGNSLVVRGTTNITANVWTHVAFVRSGSTITIYINGIASGTATNTLGNSSLNVVGAIAQGGAPNFYFFNGYIDELRVSKFARYTANFTPQLLAFSNQ